MLCSACVEVTRLNAVIAGQVQTVVAPVQPVAVPDGWFVIEADSMAAFRRFYECAMDSEGHDVPASIMKVLVGIGLVQRRYASYYETTDFGLAVLGGNFAAPAAQGDAKDTERWREFERALRTGHFQGAGHGRRFKIIETCPMYGDEKEFNDFIGAIDAAIAAKAASK